MKKFTAGVLLFAMALPATAADLDIHEAISVALKSSPTILSTREAKRQAIGTKVAADGLYTPSLAATGKLADQKESLVTLGSRSDSRTAALTLTQTLYSGGRNPALKKQAESELRIADAAVTDAEEALAVKVYGYFYNVLLARETVAAARDAVTTSQQHVKQVQQMIELGLANKLELIRAQQQLSSNQADVSSALTTLDAAEINLLNAMGLPPQPRPHVVGTLMLTEPAGSKEVSAATAMKNRADLSQLVQQIEYQKQQINITRSAMNPTVNLTASLLAESPYNKVDTNHDDWEASLNLNIPIYDRNQTRGSVIKAKSVLEQRVLAKQQKELDIKSSTETAWIQINNSADRVKARDEALKLAKETLRLSQVGFREGVTPQLDLLSAQASFTSARKDYSQSLYDHLMCIVELKRVEGILIPWTYGGRRP